MIASWWGRCFGLAMVWALIGMVLIGVGAAVARPEPTVVLLVFGGWAPGLIEPSPPPALRRIQQEGAFTHHLIPEFPTSSIVAQVTLSTGCFPSSHGIVSDRFIDPEHGLFDRSRDSRWLTGCEHLHAAARRQGVSVRTWRWFDEEQHAVAGEPVEEILEALRLPEPQRPHLLIAYFGTLQDSARASGLRSRDTRDAVAQSDLIVGKVMEEIERFPETESATLIVATDHGLLPVWANINVARVLYENEVNAEFTGAGATAFLYFDGPEERLDALRHLQPYQRQFRTVLKDAQPVDWHLGTSARVGDLILAARPPYFIESADHWPAGLRWLVGWGPELLWARPFVKAKSGYDLNARGMDGLLYAWGSGIAPTGEITRLRSVDLHPTVCALLGITPGSPVDGGLMPGLLSVEE